MDSKNRDPSDGSHFAFSRRPPGTSRGLTSTVRVTPLRRTSNVTVRAFEGTTLDPKVRRAAFHVDDHELGHAGFEGVIPGGRYGSGDVIVWDNGTWQPGDTDDPGAALTAGELHFDLFGAKLRGRFVLVRSRVDAHRRVLDELAQPLGEVDAARLAQHLNGNATLAQHLGQRRGERRLARAVEPFDRDQPSSHRAPDPIGGALYDRRAH